MGASAYRRRRLLRLCGWGRSDFGSKWYFDPALAVEFAVRVQTPMKDADDFHGGARDPIIDSRTALERDAAQPGLQRVLRRAAPREIGQTLAGGFDTGDIGEGAGGAGLRR